MTNECFLHTASIIGYYIYILTLKTYFKVLFSTPVQFALKFSLNRHLEKLFRRRKLQMRFKWSIKVNTLLGRKKYFNKELKIK